MRNISMSKNMRSLKVAAEIEETVHGTDKKIKYELRAIVNHHGEFQNAGHYTCFARRFDAISNDFRWYFFNDEEVTKLEDDAIEDKAPRRDMVWNSSESAALLYEKTVDDRLDDVKLRAVEFYANEFKHMAEKNKGETGANTEPKIKDKFKAFVGTKFEAHAKEIFDAATEVLERQKSPRAVN